MKEKKKKLGKWYRLGERIPPEIQHQLYHLVGALPGGIRTLTQKELVTLWVARRLRRKEVI